MCEHCDQDRAWIASGGVPAKADWKVYRIKDHGPGRVYRYHVEGENLGIAPGPRRPFSWSVPDVDSPRYDLTEAVWEVSLTIPQLPR